MALQDSLSAIIRAEIRSSLSRIQDVGEFSGLDRYDHLAAQALTNGSGARQALGAFTSQLTVTIGGVTISLADFADPLGAAGDDQPSSDPEGTRLRAIQFENLDDPVTGNFFRIAPGANGLTSWLEGTSPTLRVPAGGVQLASFPNGLDIMNDGVDDELLLTADTADVLARLTYLFG